MKSGWASAFAHTMVADAPDKYVATITKSKRLGKILIDFFRNDYTATAIASYSLHARAGVPVTVPLEWRELANGLTPITLSIYSAIRYREAASS